MKRTLLSIPALVAGLATMAQFGTAPDFTVTDINSATHNLYTWLNDGKVVIVDCSATWCGPCWNLHQSGSLEALENNYGPNGTDQLRVLYYEADASTTMADLNGTTGSSQGDWITGTPYPIVNESPLTLNGNVWWPQGFPTVSLIRPSDKEITADMWNYSYNQMVTAINQIITLNAVGVSEQDAELSGVSVYPVPVEDLLTIDIAATDLAIDDLLITDAVGRVVGTVPVGQDAKVQADVSAYPAGVYQITFRSAGAAVGTKTFVK